MFIRQILTAVTAILFCLVTHDSSLAGPKVEGENSGTQLFIPFTVIQPYQQEINSSRP